MIPLAGAVGGCLLRLPGVVDGLVFPPRGWLGTGRPDDRGFGVGRSAAGYPLAAAQTRLDPPYRSGRAVCWWRLPPRAAAGRHGTEHEPPGQLLRQCLYGVVLRHDQNRTRNAELRGAAYRPGRDPRVLVLL